MRGSCLISESLTILANQTSKDHYWALYKVVIINQPASLADWDVLFVVKHVIQNNDIMN
jgi:hypothetical protein